MGYKPPSPMPQQTAPLPQVQQSFSPIPQTSSAVAAPIPIHEVGFLETEDSIKEAERKMKAKKSTFQKASKRAFIFRRIVYKNRSRGQKCGHVEAEGLVDGLCAQHKREYDKAKKEYDAAVKKYHQTKEHKGMEFEYAIRKMTDALNIDIIDMGDTKHEIDMLQKLMEATQKQLHWKFIALQQEANK